MGFEVADMLLSRDQIVSIGSLSVVWTLIIY